MSMFLRLARLSRATTGRPIVAIISANGRRSIGSVSAIDSSIFRTLFGTEEVRKVGRLPWALVPIFSLDHAD
jgi:hypothetical protein